MLGPKGVGRGNPGLPQWQVHEDAVSVRIRER
jgi:hypothetical protein